MWFLLACTEDDDVKTAVSAWGDDVAVAPDAEGSEAEPTVAAVGGGVFVGAWMNVSGGDVWVRRTRSTDGGGTWSAPELVDDDGFGYQNDPVLVSTDGHTMLSWLAVEEDDAGDRFTRVWCQDSEDGGLTWSDKVDLTGTGELYDRQWMAVDGSGRAAMTFSWLPRAMKQLLREGDGTCGGFGEAEEIADGVFMNGTPVYDVDGDLWVGRSRIQNERGAIVLAHRQNGAWSEIELLDWSVPEGSEEWLATEAARELLGEEGPEDERPTQDVEGAWDGAAAPALVAHPDGGVIVAGLVGESSRGYADVGVFHVARDGTSTRVAVHDVDDEVQQEEPWIAAGPDGRVYVTWFDAREGDWRLYGAWSDDGGATYQVDSVGDTVFEGGFDEEVARAQWLGHYQGLTADAEGPLAFWSDPREGTATIWADRLR